MKTVTVAAALAILAMAGPLVQLAGATPRHHHHRHHAVGPAASGGPAVAAAPAATPFSFYPNEIDGGVSGNLPFNNQLRKLKDPLNAAGAGR